MSRSFNGSSDLITVGDVTALRPGSGSFSVSAWVQTTVLGTLRHIISKGQAAVPNYQLFLTASNRFRFVGESGGGSFDVFGPTTVQINTWYHVLGVRTAGAGAKLYINGVLEGVSDVDTAGDVNTTEPFKIGVGTSTFFWSGLIAEVAFWKTALSYSDVLRVYWGKASYTLTGLVTGYWPLLGTSSPEPDTSGNGNNGTLTGTVAGMHPTLDVNPNLRVDLRAGFSKINFNHPLTQNLTAGLFFKEGNGVTVADLVDDHSGTISGLSWTTSGCGGQGVIWGSGFIDLANPGAFNFGTADFSIIARLKRDSSTDFKTIISKTAAGAWELLGKQFYIRNNANGNSLAFDGFGVGTVAASTGLTVDQCYMCGVSFNDSNNAVKLYLDGVLDGSGTLVLPADSGSHVVRLGVLGNIPQYMAGVIDYLLIYNRVLSDNEFAAIAANPTVFLLTSTGRTPTQRIRPVVPAQRNYQTFRKVF